MNLNFRVGEANKAACALLDTLLDPVRGPSYDAKDAAICKMRDWPKTWFDWHAVRNIHACTISRHVMLSPRRKLKKVQGSLGFSVVQ